MRTTLPADDRDPLTRPPGAGAGLEDLGWDDAWGTALLGTADPTLPVGRVSRIDRGAMTVLTGLQPQRVRAPRGLAVAVGDWVTIGSAPGTEDLPPVAAVLPRRSVFRRVTEGAGALEQVVAANIDTVFVVDAVDGPLSAAHLQRYVALAFGSGAVPVVVITKADLATSDEVDAWVTAIERTAPGVRVIAISTTTGRGVGDLAPYLSPGRTAALLGMSGAGKSTLVNALARRAILATGEVRPDGHGRHVTTHRQLVLLPGGGLIIDTPGMRALSVWGAGVGMRLAFADLETLARGCDFADCSHEGERGCAVQAALATGQVASDRLASWLTLRDQRQPVDPGAARLQVLNRKRRKAAAKLARRAVRTETVKARDVPGSGLDVDVDASPPDAEPL